MGGLDETTVFASSDHGFAPQWYAVNASQGAGRPWAPGRQSSNCRTAATPRPANVPGDTLVKDCYAGGTAQFYIEPGGPRSGGTASSAGDRLPVHQ